MLLEELRKTLLEAPRCVSVTKSDADAASVLITGSI